MGPGRWGFAEFIFEDLKDRFASEFAFASVRAGATYQDDYLLGTALGRPLIAERMAHFAQQAGRLRHLPWLHGQRQRPAPL